MFYLNCNKLAYIPCIWSSFSSIWSSFAAISWKKVYIFRLWFFIHFFINRTVADRITVRIEVCIWLSVFIVSLILTDVYLIHNKLIYILLKCSHSWGHCIPWKKKWYIGITWRFFLSVLVYYISFWVSLEKTICTDKTKMTKIAFVVWKHLAKFGAKNKTKAKTKTIFFPRNYVWYCF